MSWLQCDPPAFAPRSREACRFAGTPSSGPVAVDSTTGVTGDAALVADTAVVADGKTSAAAATIATSNTATTAANAGRCEKKLRRGENGSAPSRFCSGSRIQWHM